MVEIVDDLEMVAASEREATGPMDSALEDDPYQETSLANELKQMDHKDGRATQQTNMDDDSIPFNIQDYLTKHNVSVWTSKRPASEIVGLASYTFLSHTNLLTFHIDR